MYTFRFLFACCGWRTKLIFLCIVYICSVHEKQVVQYSKLDFHVTCITEQWMNIWIIHIISFLPSSSSFLYVSLVFTRLWFDWIFGVALSNIINLFIILNGITLTSFVRFFVNYLSNKHGIKMKCAHSELSECVSFMSVLCILVCLCVDVQIFILDYFPLAIWTGLGRPPLISFLIYFSVFMLFIYVFFSLFKLLFVFSFHIFFQMAFLLFFFTIFHLHFFFTYYLKYNIKWQNNVFLFTWIHESSRSKSRDNSRLSRQTISKTHKFIRRLS